MYYIYIHMLYICCTYVVPCYTQCIAISINFNGTTDEPEDFWSGQQLPRSIELEVARGARFCEILWHPVDHFAVRLSKSHLAIHLRTS